MSLTFDSDTIPGNSSLMSALYPAGRGTVNAIIDPQTYNPDNPTSGTWYLILEEIIAVSGVGPAAWLNADGTSFSAAANDIIEWDGSQWNIVFDSTVAQPVTYITNMYTGIQYVWDGTQWSKSYEGVYAAGDWRLVL